MRRDMYKVIVERPRVGGRSSKKSPKRSAVARSELKRLAIEGSFLDADGDEYVNDNLLDRHEPVKSRFDGHKSLNENLSPLFRFLEKSVGRPWDEVYSEIRENLRLDSSVQYHVVQHLRYAVTLNTFLGDDGHIYEGRLSSGYPGTLKVLDVPNRYNKHRFYVHPVTKILCQSPWLTNKDRKDNREGTNTKLFYSEYRQFRLIDGNWKVVELAEIPYGAPEFAPSGTVSVFNKQTKFFEEYPKFDFDDALGVKGDDRANEYGHWNRYAVLVRDPGRREKKKLEELLRDANS